MLDRLVKLCESVLAESKVKQEEIHSVELVGEATRIPAVIQKIQESMKAPISRTMNSADCVARGCAIQCAIFSPLFKVRDYAIIDLNPFPVDVAYNLPKNDKGVEQKKVRTLFDKGSNFPVTKALSFENRKEPVEIQLMYNLGTGALPLGGPTLLGNFKINPGTPVEEKFTLSVKITLDHNMIPYVSVAETVEDYMEEKKVVVKRDVPTPPPVKKEEKKEEKKESPKPSKMEDVKEEAKKTEDKAEAKSEPAKEEKMTDIPVPPVQPPQQEYEIQKVPKKRKTPIDFQYEVHGLASKKITEFIEQEKKMEHEDIMIITTKEAKNSLESYIYEMRAKIPAEYSAYTDPNTAQKLLELVDRTESWLFGEGREQAKDIYMARLGDLQQIGAPIAARFRAFGQLADKALLWSNVYQKAADFVPAMNKDEKYTAEDKEGLAKLLQEQAEWVRGADDDMKKCPRTSDPTVKVTDYIERIKKIEDVRDFAIIMA